MSHDYFFLLFTKKVALERATRKIVDLSPNAKKYLIAACKKMIIENGTPQEQGDDALILSLLECADIPRFTEDCNPLDVLFAEYIKEEPQSEAVKLYIVYLGYVSRYIKEYGYNLY